MNNIKKFLSRNVFPLITRLLPIKKNTIVFSSFGGRNYSGNPKVISEKIYEKNLPYKIIWLIKKDAVIEDLPTYVKRIDTDTFLASYYLYTAKFWVDDSRKTIRYTKRIKQIYFQTWHGTPLKKIEFDAVDKLPDRYLNYAKKDSESITYLLSGNRYSTEKYKSAFKVDSAKIIEIGTPRNDKLVEEQKQLISETNLFKENITILFAPTFRDKFEKNGMAQLKKLEINKLQQFFQERNQNLDLMVKFHPNVNALLLKDQESKSYMENNKITLVPDGQVLETLFADIDILITDYSSIFFDYALLKKPVILFNYDEKEYSIERGFYVSLDDLPLFKAQNVDMLIDIFSNHSDQLLHSSQKLLDYIGNTEIGKSTERVIELIEREEK
ncbi:CDP-glycerol glycerophosphotransferase family protein [Enterococcus durans]|uniref:CDP-glycerol glycerophosphotransferase family protein n=1 Tax=Enterococcus durans TaxID=53345 RepID=UPI00232E46E5|nr:CDP-glycerol glycerophosphotransferase family protein [Enterococcus durans]MDB1654214.1 CDP-glycerol glycerophosphotransferase family protein [Enterococcus durans]MDB1656839.1 CDP-glycerol glycerophosphotransferase family protein [Enterococcus durans]MDB1664903.1 CDP-glycerol glycerophosphotransferase family protein [Enterococcus durans]MDB1670159.1 CDP-glycerol glycerophosphotransferase family protein [Enterococcus durans]MDB1671488.1 CDP-glycerol glycerophosphotransferase family protein [